MRKIETDLCVVGGGSGGYGAALAAARRGLHVTLLEAAWVLGGNSTLGGVNTWEPGISGPGLHKELFDRMQESPNAVALSQTVQFYQEERPWGWSKPAPNLDYRGSLRRSSLDSKDWIRVTFEPESLANEMKALLLATRNVELLFGTSFTEVRMNGGSIAEIRARIEKTQEELVVLPRYVIDSTAEIHLARKIGCQTSFGSETRSEYQEPSAPDFPQKKINGVSVIFRVSPKRNKGMDIFPGNLPGEDFKVPVQICEYPNGDLNMNALPLMEGWEWHERVLRYGEKVARRSCEERLLRLWRYLQRERDFDGYGMKMIFPLTGVREGPRLKTRRVLTERDLRSGFRQQEKSPDGERIIALADHALDVHGEGNMCRELDEPYGIYFDCLLPKECDNLAVACRGAGFSQIAASSCRLSRTMMDLGHAAGLAVAEAASRKEILPMANLHLVRKWLADENVALNPADPRFPQVLSS